MNGIANDGDLGDLGRDTVGAAGLGVSPEHLDEFRTAMSHFHAACSAIEASQDQAEQAVAMLESWVTVGEKALAIVGPILQTLVARHTAAPPADGTAPPAATRIGNVAALLDGFRTQISGGLAPLFAGATA